MNHSIEVKMKVAGSLEVELYSNLQPDSLVAGVEARLR